MPLQWRRSRAYSLGAGLVGTALVLGALYLASLRSYLLFHTLIELFTVTVAAGIFVVVWNARGFLANGYLLFVGVASIFVALLDLFHTLAYEGMGVFPGGGSDLPTQLWLSGRTLQAASVVLAPWLLGRRPAVRLWAAGFAVATALLLAAIYWGVFPPTYVEGRGLTPFKVVAEYVLSGAFALAALLLYRKRAAFEPAIWRLLAASLLLTTASELAFTLYVDVYGTANLLGHMLRLLAYYLLYKAIIETGLIEPYAVLLRELKQSEARLREDAVMLESRNEALQASEARLREQAQDLRERNQELDAFTRTVAHDLKTPLSVVVNNAEVLATVPDLPEERREELLRRMSATAFAMSGIIDHLLLLSEVRKVDAPRTPLDMPAIVARAVDRLREMIDATGADVRVPGDWPAALGHGPWIEEVWVNYLSNALKHGGDPPRIELGGEDADGRPRFWVRDHGPGIPADARHQLFVPFRRLAGARGAGHGLGLSIVLHIVEKLGGEVGAEDDGEGALFYFSLPPAGDATPAED